MVTKTESGLAIYAELEDRAGATVGVRRCFGNPPRVVITVLPREGPYGPPELDVEQAKAIRDALDTFVRRAGVHDDAGLPKKRFSPEPHDS